MATGQTEGAPDSSRQGVTSLERLTGAMARVAGWCVFAMIAVTVFDVLSNNLLRRPIRGTFEIVELLVATTVFLALPDIFRLHLNIVVDVVDHFVGAVMRQRLILLGSLVTLLFLGLTVYAMINPALDTIQFPERRQDTGLPTWAFWVPIILGTAACLAAAAVDAWQRLSRPIASEHHR